MWRSKTIVNFILQFGKIKLIDNIVEIFRIILHDDDWRRLNCDGVVDVVKEGRVLRRKEVYFNIFYPESKEVRWDLLQRIYLVLFFRDLIIQNDELLLDELMNGGDDGEGNFIV